jgi:hypothetical protein
MMGLEWNLLYGFAALPMSLVAKKARQRLMSL